MAHEPPAFRELPDSPAPDPAAFGLSAEDDGARTDPLVGQNMISCPHYEHDRTAQAPPIWTPPYEGTVYTGQSSCSSGTPLERP